MTKDDLVSMVRYGAELVFQAGTSNITEEDVDAILAKGERETKELNDKMKQFEEDAIKFTLDGGLSAYDYKGPQQPEEAMPDINLKVGLGFGRISDFLVQNSSKLNDYSVLI